MRRVGDVLMSGGVILNGIMRDMGHDILGGADVP